MTPYKFFLLLIKHRTEKFNRLTLNLRFNHYFIDTMHKINNNYEQLY